VNLYRYMIEHPIARAYIPAAPLLRMPEPAQTIFLWLTVCMAAVVLVIAIIMSRRYRSPTPLFMVSGALVAIVMEPIVTYLGHAVHPDIGAVVMFRAVDRTIPWHIGLGYLAAYGTVYLILYPRMVARSITTAYIWKLLVVAALVFALFEIVPVMHGLWVYYGYQPLRPWPGMAPIAWNFLNASSMIGGATLMYVALTRLRGWSQILLIPLAAVGTAMTHVGAGLPLYVGMNAALPQWAVQLCALAAVALSLVLVWLCTVVIELIQRQSAPSAVGI